MTFSLSSQLVTYILAAMTSWVPLRNQYDRAHDGKWLHDDHGLYVQESEDKARSRYEQTAREIVSVAYDELNAPLFKGEDGRLKTALVLASIASFEGGYHEWVENGDCNTPEWKKNHPHECDGGIAFTNWQIHMYGYVVKDGELTQSQYLRNSLNSDDRDWMTSHEGEIIRGADVIRDHRLAAQLAYYIVRYSTRNFKSLCGYTGEACDGRHDKATLRMDRAVQYLRSHPFTYVEEAVTGSGATSLVEDAIFDSPFQTNMLNEQIRNLFAWNVPSRILQRDFLARDFQMRLGFGFGAALHRMPD